MRRGRGNTSAANRNGPGLLRTVGTTAVVAGTATVTSNKVNSAMQNSAQQRALEEQRRAAAEQQRFDEAVQRALAQQVPAVEQAPAPAAAPAAAPNPDRIAQLQQLAELRAQGILTDDEFAAEKARILGS